ncbi:MAG: dTDP-4-dehydrorhamnose reductase [Lachnospiraceae bacterium]|nr:dTDP-4-dehydrorhamnose reductase [Lachnospiraceae bacterium]
MKKVIVTGANGQLGRAINQIMASEYELIRTDFSVPDFIELDITDNTKALDFVREVKPYAIINCAAHTAVDACETDIDNAYRINAIGPRNLSIAAYETKAKLVHISTDYVFDGKGNIPYKEFDPTGPTGVYGASKLAGENFVKDFAKDYFILRTAWLYGDGKNFVQTMLKLAENNEKIRVVSDQIGTPTSAMELARAIAWLLPSDNYGLFHSTCEGSCSWADFAEEIFRLYGLNTAVERISSAEFKTTAASAAARRPAFSVLHNYMLELCGGYRFASWRDALREYRQGN